MFEQEPVITCAQFKLNTHTTIAPFLENVVPGQLPQQLDVFYQAAVLMSKRSSPQVMTELEEAPVDLTPADLADSGALDAVLSFAGDLGTGVVELSGTAITAVVEGSGAILGGIAEGIGDILS